MALSVIGAGFGRTGTLSLKHALELLGLGPCYHMLEVRKHPEHDRIWLDAVEHRAVDWDALFAGYRSSCDWPQCQFWPELAAHYPDAKVILTLRDPARWYASISGTIFETLSRDADPADGAAVLHRKMTRRLIHDLVFDGRWRDESHVLDVYRRHAERVQRELPARRLLVYDVAHGWEPLCAFLDVAIPDAPFPNVNSTAEFRARSAAAKT